MKYTLQPKNPSPRGLAIRYNNNLEEIKDFFRDYEGEFDLKYDVWSGKLETDYDRVDEGYFIVVKLDEDECFDSVEIMSEEELKSEFNVKVVK